MGILVVIFTPDINIHDVLKYYLVMFLSAFLSIVFNWK